MTTPQLRFLFFKEVLNYDLEIWKDIPDEIIQRIKSIKTNLANEEKSQDFFLTHTGFEKTYSRHNFLTSLLNPHFVDLVEPTSNPNGVPTARGVDSKFRSKSDGGLSVPGVSPIKGLISDEQVQEIRDRTLPYLDNAILLPGTAGKGSTKDPDSFVTYIYGHDQSGDIRRDTVFHEIEVMVRGIMARSTAVKEYFSGRQMDVDKFLGRNKYQDQFSSIGIVEYQGNSRSKLAFHIDTTRSGGGAIIIPIVDARTIKQQQQDPCLFYSKSNLKKKGSKEDIEGVCYGVGDMCFIPPGREHKTPRFKCVRIVLFIFFNVPQGDLGAYSAKNFGHSGDQFFS
jgi:hypothetical protein